MLSERSHLEEELDRFESAVHARALGGAPLLDLSDARSPVLDEDDGERVRSALAHALDGMGAAPLASDAIASEAVAASLAEEGARVDPSRVQITASPLEGFAHVLTLLCDPGDELLFLGPADRSLSDLAHAAGVHLAVTSDADPSGAWEHIGERTRGIFLASPTLPTGRYPTRDELEALGALELPLIVDERAHACAIAAPDTRARAAVIEETLVLAIDGLEARGLPVELGWIAIGGPEHLAREAGARLARLAAPTHGARGLLARALPALLAVRGPYATLIAHVQSGLRALRSACDGTRVLAPTVEGGRLAPMRVRDGGAPARAEAGTGEARDVALSLALLERGVRLMPGSAHGLDGHEGWLVASLLADPEALARGVAILAELG